MPPFYLFSIERRGIDTTFQANPFQRVEMIPRFAIKVWFVLPRQRAQLKVEKGELDWEKSLKVEEGRTFPLVYLET